MSKKCLAVLLAIVMLFACAASAYGFSDTNNHWANTAIEKWSDAGVVKGYSDGTFKPDANITRAEFAVMLNRILKLTGVDGSFTDVETGDWFYNDVMALAKAKVVNGYSDGTFRPNAPITREEASAMFARAFALVAKSTELSFSDKAAISAWALEAVAAMSEGKYINGYPDGSFKPQGLITRAEVVTIINNASSLKAIADYLAAQEKPADKPTTPTTPSGGSVRPSKPVAKTEEPSVDNIVKIQPYSALTYYGVGLVKVEITYAKNVDLSEVDEDTYILEDRGNLNPAFGQLPIESVSVDGRVVTLIIDRDTTANDKNALVYSGAAATGSRSKDCVYGLNVTTSWYRCLDGSIVDDDNSDLNGALRGYQFRNLELKLYHDGEAASDALCQADELGKYQAADKWLPENIQYITDSKRVDNGAYDYSQGGFMTFADLGINIPSDSGIKGDYVKGIVAFPDNYSPNKQYPLILSFPGGGTALWEVTADGRTFQNGGVVIAENPYGCCFFDGSAFKWYENDAEAIVIYMDHRYRSPFVPTVKDFSDLSGTAYNYVKDDKNVIDYFIAHYGAKANHVILTGNSQGTMASSNFIKAYPGVISTFICCNGSFGGGGSGFNADQMAAIADSGMSTWIFDGEYDSNNIPVYGKAQAAYAKAGRSAAETADNLRITGIAAEYNYYWGETDHSATKFVYWYLLNNTFYGNGKVVDQQVVYDSKTAASYELEGRKNTDGSYVKAGFQYKVYTDQTLLEWALDTDRELENVSGLKVADIQSIQAYTDQTFYGQCLTKVEITYKAGVKVPATLNAASYQLVDRGYACPDFKAIRIADVSVSGQKVTLTVSTDTYAVENNVLAYADDTERGRDLAGCLYTSANWYRDTANKIHYGDDPNDEYEYAPTQSTGAMVLGYQTRESLELKLNHSGESYLDAACLANADGSYKADGLWEETINANFGVLDAQGKVVKNGFFSLEQMGIEIPSSSKGSPDGDGDDFVKAYVYIPDNYDANDPEGYALAINLSGSLTAYWKAPDGSNNFGTNITFDASAADWMDEKTIVLSIHDRSQTGGKNYYDYVLDDINVMKYFVDNYNINEDQIIMTGSSRGTRACCTVISALNAGVYNQVFLDPPMRTIDKNVYDFDVDVFISCAGTFGGGWTADMWETLTAGGLAVWIYQGEADYPMLDAYPTYQKAITLYQQAGYSDQWIADNVRLTIIPTEIFHYWGEIDHSSSRVGYWYFYDQILYGSDVKVVNGELVYGTKVMPGNTYQVKGTGQGAVRAGRDFMVYADTLAEWSRTRDGYHAQYPTAVDLADIPNAKDTPLDENWLANQLPITGYYKANLTGDFADREIRYYIPETAILRPYYHFIAIDNDVDVDEFLVLSGWKQIADETGECIYILLPGEGGWGDIEDEVGYIGAARAYHQGPGAQYFTTFGLYYFEGYGAGAAPLEAWAAYNPQFVISQAYVNGESVGAQYLNATGATSCGWGSMNMTDGDVRGDRTVNGHVLILDQMAERLNRMTSRAWGDENALMNKGDFPLPTWLINYGPDSDSLAYWKTVNKAAAGDQGPVYEQTQITWATEYSGNISKVVAKDNVAAYGYAFNRALRDDLTDYTRYDSTISYGNAINYRMDYTALEVEHFSKPDTTVPTTGQVEGIIHDGSVVKGEMTLVSIKDENQYPADTVIYVPESAPAADIPVVVVLHGASQNSHLFGDITMWWQVAAENGFAIAVVTRTLPANANVLEDEPAIFLAVRNYLLADGRFDMSRLYCSGQSKGSVATQHIAEDDRTSGFVAAAYATNLATTGAVTYTNEGEPVPMGAVIGEGNHAFRGVPGFTTNDAAVWPYAPVYHDPLTISGKVENYAKWIYYWSNAWNLDPVKDLSDTVVYQIGNSLNGGKDMVGTIADWDTNNARLRIFNWTNPDNIPVLQYTFSLYEAHNNLSCHAQLCWDFLQNYRLDLTTGERFYSASGFTKDDAQLIVCGPEAQPLEETPAAKDTPLAENWDENQLPLTGYFSKQLDGGREVRFYIPETAILRPYFHFIAIDNGVDVDEFLFSSGWKQIADETGECLFIMLPGEGGWGDLESEVAYIKSAQAYHGRNPYFTTFGLFYLEGYGAGAAPLEAWAAENPNLVISQAYIGGESAGNAQLTALGSTSYGWKHMTDGDIPGKVGKTAESSLSADGSKQLALVQMTERLKTFVNADDTGNEGLLQKDDMPVPTWLINGSAESLGYWLAVNKAAGASALDGFGLASVSGSLFSQQAQTWATEYAGNISKVVAMNIANAEGYAFNRELRDQLTDYSRYDATISYGNALNYRVDYTALQVERFTTGYARGIVSAPTRDGAVDVDMILTKLDVNDSYSTDTLLFVPETAGEANIPVVLVWHGGSQNGHLFMDSTLWWQVAAENGFAILLTTRTNPANVLTATWTATETLDAVLAFLEEDGRFDMGRIYSSGQSAGGGFTADLMEEHNHGKLAGCFTSSSQNSLPSGEPFVDAIPYGLSVGEGNSSNRGIPCYADKAEADAAGVVIRWDDNDGAGNSTSVLDFFQYFADTNAAVGANLSPVIRYSGSSDVNQGTDIQNGSIADWNNTTARFRTFTWNTDDGLPIMRYIFTLYEAHNNLCSHAELMWEFLQCYRIDANGNRYYSASGFAEDDEQLLYAVPQAADLKDIPNAKNTPVDDSFDVNQLPITGYYKASLSGDYADREIRYYIPETAVLRPYYHFIAVDDDVNVDSFLMSSGWKKIADETGECLYFLLPGEGGWGNTTDEVGYIAAARAFHQAGGAQYFTTWGLYYLEGYGAGAAPLEAWAAANSNLVIAQAYMDGDSAGMQALAAGGARSFGWKQMTDGDMGDDNNNGKQDVLEQYASRLKDVVNPLDAGNEGLLQSDDLAVPTWLINYSGNDSLVYWKEINEAQAVNADSAIASFGGQAASGAVYNQKAVNWATVYSGNISKVTFMNIGNADGYAFNKALRDALTAYTRYDNSICYGNALNYRLDYTALQVERFADQNVQVDGDVSGIVRSGAVVDGHIYLDTLTIAAGYKDDSDLPMDVLLYVPETAPASNIPVVVVSHGGSQTSNLFMDSTMWWQVAAENGFAVILTTRTYPANNPATAYTNREMLEVELAYLASFGTKFDLTRVYTTGQSAGGSVTLDLGATAADLLAAICPSNSAPNRDLDALAAAGTVGDFLPAGIVISEGNYDYRGLPGYTSEAEANADGYMERWDPKVDPRGMFHLSWRGFMDYFTTANKLDPISDLVRTGSEVTVQYRGASSLYGDSENMIGTMEQWYTNNARFRTFYWENAAGQPVMSYTWSLYEAHNNLCSHAELMWDFMKHYSLEAGQRYYSASGFTADDAVLLDMEMTAQELTAQALPVNTPSEGNQLEVTGFYYADLASGRQIYYYVPETAILRPYFHFIAVPNGVDVAEFLLSTGWKRVSDLTGECLMLLVPDQATKEWGNPDAELAYITAARNYHAAKPSTNYFTTFGEFYLTGYGEGAAPLEAWAATNPNLVIAQAYVGGDSYDAAKLTAIGATSFGWQASQTDGDKRMDDSGKRLILDEITGRLQEVPNRSWGDDDALLNKEDLVVPTWLVNGDGLDLAYWQGINQADATADAEFDAFAGAEVAGQVYQQTGENWATLYCGPISQVTTIEGQLDIYDFAFTNALRGELTNYSRYDTTTPYGNALCYRVDYTGLQYQRFLDGEASGTVEYQVSADGAMASAEMELTKLALPTGTVTDTLLFVPESAVEKYGVGNIPIVYVQHGGSQNGHLFFDSTVWWKTATEEGFALVFNTRTTNGSGAKAIANLDCFDAIYAYLQADGRFDLSRLYTSGQSAGAQATVACAQSRATKLAGAYATGAGVPSLDVDSTGGIPYGVIMGEGNHAGFDSCRAIPGGYTVDSELQPSFQERGVYFSYWASSTATNAGANITWDPMGTADNPLGFAKLTRYFYAANGISDADLNNAILYSGSTSLFGGTDGEGVLADFDVNTARFRTFTWENQDDVAVLQYVFSLYQAHNCLPGFRPIIWDFFEHYSVDPATGVHYYSASGDFTDKTPIDFE